jgi:hypothetical protein
VARRANRNGPGAIGPALAAKIAEIVATGETSPTAIAKALEGRVTRQAIYAHLKKRTRVLGQPEPTAGQSEREPETEAVEVLGEGLGGGLVDVRRRLERTRKLLDRLEPMIENLTCPPATWVALGKFEADLAERVQALTPPEPPDPERDPVNVDATKRVVAKLARAIAAAEKKLVCQNCGKRPW